MAFSLGGGMGAGAGADMLQAILKQKALEFAQAEQIRLAEARTAQEGERIKADADWRRMQQQDRDDAMTSRQAELDANRAEKVAAAEKEGTLGKLRSAYIGSQNLAGTSDPSGAPATRGALRVAMASGGAKMNEIPQEPVEPKIAKPPSVQEYEYAVSHDGFKGSYKDYQDEDANRKKLAAGGGSSATPYFTFQPIYDKDGTPKGAIRFDARGGPPVVIDVAGATGGGQIKPPPGTTGKEILANEVSATQLNRLKTMFDQGANKLVGPASGRWEGLKQAIPGVDVNKTFSDFSAATSAFKNSVIKAITGAAMSEPEAKRIVAQIPLETDKPEVWLSKYEQTIANLKDIGNIVKSKGGLGGAAPAGTASPAGAAPPRQGIRYDMNGNPIKD